MKRQPLIQIDVSAPKAVSQNLMHENLTITDGVYGILSDKDVRKQIAALGSDITNNNDVQELRLLVSRLLAKLERTSVTQ